MSVCVNVLVAFDVRLAWVAVRSGQRVTVASCEQPTIVDSVAEDASVVCRHFSAGSKWPDTRHLFVTDC